MATATERRTTTERFANLFREMKQTDVYHIEGAKVEIAEQIYLAMKRHHVSNAELARRLGKSRAYVTKVLQGSTNFTLESLVRIARALDCQLDLQFSPRHKAFVSQSKNQTRRLAKLPNQPSQLARKRQPRAEPKPLARNKG